MKFPTCESDSDEYSVFKVVENVIDWYLIKLLFRGRECLGRSKLSRPWRSINVTGTLLNVDQRLTHALQSARQRGGIRNVTISVWRDLLTILSTIQLETM